MKQQFKLEGHPHIALCDLLKLTGIVESGGRAKQVISAGLVQRNGQAETRKTAKLIAGDCIDFQGQIIDIID